MTFSANRHPLLALPLAPHNLHCIAVQVEFPHPVDVLQRVVVHRAFVLQPYASRPLPSLTAREEQVGVVPLVQVAVGTHLLNYLLVLRTVGVAPLVELRDGQRQVAPHQRVSQQQEGHVQQHRLDRVLRGVQQAADDDSTSAVAGQTHGMGAAQLPHDTIQVAYAVQPVAALALLVPARALVSAASTITRTSQANRIAG